MAFAPKSASSAVANQYTLTSEVTRDGVHVLDHDENPDIDWVHSVLSD
jgi:hypothetical protein